MRNLLIITISLAGLAVAGLAAVVPALAGDGSLPELQDVRAAVAKYHSFEQAERDGYTVENEPCVASHDCTMGIHAINPALLADNAIHVDRPEILLYVPKANGKLELVGVEYWKADADQNLGTNSDLPSLFGRAFEGPMPGHGPPGAMPIHYDMHVWVAEENSSGVFALFNPALSCS